MSLNTAFEITTDDVENACYIHFDKKISWETAEEIIELLSINNIQNDALNGDDIEEQTNIAIESIKQQIESNQEILDILKRS